MQRLSERIQTLTDALASSGCMTPAQVTDCAYQMADLARRYIPEERHEAFAEEIKVVLARCLEKKEKA